MRIAARPDIRLTLLVAAGMLVLGRSAGAQTADPQLLSLSCAGCHGPAGHSPGPMPSLFGRTATAIAESMRAFRADQRPSTVMGRIAKGYTDAEIQRVAQDIAAAWK